MKALVVSVVLVVVAVIVYGLSGTVTTIRDYHPPREMWWGVGEKPNKEDETIREFSITVDKNVMTDLQSRLENTRYFDPIVEDNIWIRGTLPNFTKELVEYWKTGFNWNTQVQRLNSHKQYKTNINGLDIHFIHEKAKRDKDTKVMPLLLLHGWPGSFFEFHSAIPLLTDPSKSKSKQFAFDVVVPSLPGYGFSEAPRKKGLSADAIALILAKLMKRLGYSSYIAQGGDYGSFFAKILPVYDPEHCIAIHLNMIISPTPWYAPFQLALASVLGPGTIFRERDHKKLLPFSDFFAEAIRESGYMHIQATRPYSVGHALTDSPAGLAAYIIEKFYYWSHNDGDIYKTFTKDQLLTNVMIYWVTNSISSSVNYYYEIIGDVKFMMLLTEEQIYVPTALADYANEIRTCHGAWAGRPYKNIVQYSQLEKGGHFAALEQPAIFSEDVLKFGELLNSKK